MSIPRSESTFSMSANSNAPVYQVGKLTSSAIKNYCKSFP
jgi:hypothetical protein